METEERHEIADFAYKNNINISDMRNTDQKLDFIRDVLGDSDKNNIINTIRKFNQFGRIEDEFNKDLIHFNANKMKNDFLKFFESFSWNHKTFAVNKCLIKSYLDWARDKKLIDGNPSQELERISYDMLSRRKMYDTYYFKSFDELKEVIEDHREDKQNFKTVSKFYMAEIVMYLAWCSIKFQDVCLIRKEDVDENRGLIYIRRTDEYIRINENKKLFDIIVDYKNNPNYIVTDMLIRTDTMPELSFNYLKVFISRYFGDNEYNTSDGKIINYNKVYWSGIYSRARLDRIANGDFKSSDTERISEIFKEDYSKLANPYAAACNRLVAFKEYMEYLFTDEVLGY